MLCLRRQMGSPLTILKIKIKELKILNLRGYSLIFYLHKHL